MPAHIHLQLRVWPSYTGIPYDSVSPKSRTIPVVHPNDPSKARGPWLARYMAGVLKVSALFSPCWVLDWKEPQKTKQGGLLLRLTTSWKCISKPCNRNHTYIIESACSSPAPLHPSFWQFLVLLGVPMPDACPTDCTSRYQTSLAHTRAVVDHNSSYIVVLHRTYTEHEPDPSHTLQSQ